MNFSESGKQGQNSCLVSHRKRCISENVVYQNIKKIYGVVTAKYLQMGFERFHSFIPTIICQRLN